jgi:hypothetical protein
LGTTIVLGNADVEPTLEFPQASPYIYQPTLWLAVAGAVAFVLVTVIHTVLFLRGKTWFFWPLVVGALSKYLDRITWTAHSADLHGVESVGFVARARSAHDLTEPYSFVVGYLALMYVYPIPLVAWKRYTNIEMLLLKQSCTIFPCRSLLCCIWSHSLVGGTSRRPKRGHALVPTSSDHGHLRLL